MNRFATLCLTTLAAVGLSACGSSPKTTQPTTVAEAPSAEPVAPSSPEPSPVTQTAQAQDLQFPEEGFRATQPAATAPRPFKLPKVQSFALKNQLTVYLVEQHTLPIVSLDLNFDGGAVADPPGKEGLSSVCMSLVSEGTQRLDKIAFSEALADVASSVSSYAGFDSQGVTMASLSKHLDTTFGLFVDTLLTPGFRADDLDRMVKRRLEALKQSKGSPDAVAARVSGPVLYGAAHPNGRIVTEASLAAITLDDCKAYHAKAIKPGGARLFVVGDMTPAQIRERFEGGALASWKGKTPALRALPKPAKPAARIFFVDIPGSAQSQVGLAHFGPLRNAPDYLPTSVMGAIFGGGFTSRINMNLREDKGYSYGARAGFNYSRNYGVLTAGASVRSDSTYQSLLELHNDMQALESGKAPATEAELTREKASAVLGLPSRFATAASSLGQFRGLVYYGLPLDYWSSFTTKMQKVTLPQVTAAAAKHLHTADAVYVIVGDAKAPMIVRNGKEDAPLMKDGKQVTLREALEQLASEGTLGKGGLQVLDADGKPVE